MHAAVEALQLSLSAAAAEKQQRMQRLREVYGAAHIGAVTPLSVMGGKASFLFFCTLSYQHFIVRGTLQHVSSNRGPGYDHWLHWGCGGAAAVLLLQQQLPLQRYCFSSAVVAAIVAALRQHPFLLLLLLLLAVLLLFLVQLLLLPFLQLCCCCVCTCSCSYCCRDEGSYGLVHGDISC